MCQTFRIADRKTWLLSAKVLRKTFNSSADDATRNTAYHCEFLLAASPHEVNCFQTDWISRFSIPFPVIILSSAAINGKLDVLIIPYLFLIFFLLFIFDSKQSHQSIEMLTGKSLISCTIMVPTARFVCKTHHLWASFLAQHFTSVMDVYPQHSCASDKASMHP
jgi:hypothetical protein